MRVERIFLFGKKSSSKSCSKGLIWHGMCTVVLSLEKYLYTDFKHKDVSRLSGVNVRILLVWGWMHWKILSKHSFKKYRKNPFLFLMGLGCMRQAQLSFPVLPVHAHWLLWCSCLSFLNCQAKHLNQLQKFLTLSKEWQSITNPGLGRVTKLLCCVQCRMHKVLTG